MPTEAMLRLEDIAREATDIMHWLAGRASDSDAIRKKGIFTDAKGTVYALVGNGKTTGNCTKFQFNRWENSELDLILTDHQLTVSEENGEFKVAFSRDSDSVVYLTAKMPKWIGPKDLLDSEIVLIGYPHPNEKDLNGITSIVLAGTNPLLIRFDYSLDSQVAKVKQEPSLTPNADPFTEYKLPEKYREVRVTPTDVMYILDVLEPTYRKIRKTWDIFSGRGMGRKASLTDVVERLREDGSLKPDVTQRLEQIAEGYLGKNTPEGMKTEGNKTYKPAVTAEPGVSFGAISSAFRLTYIGVREFLRKIGITPDPSSRLIPLEQLIMGAQDKEMLTPDIYRRLLKNAHYPEGTTMEEYAVAHPFPIKPVNNPPPIELNDTLVIPYNPSDRSILAEHLRSGAREPLYLYHEKFGAGIVRKIETGKGMITVEFQHEKKVLMVMQQNVSPKWNKEANIPDELRFPDGIVYRWKQSGGNGSTTIGLT